MINTLFKHLLHIYIFMLLVDNLFTYIDAQSSEQICYISLYCRKILTVNYVEMKLFSEN